MKTSKGWLFLPAGLIAMLCLIRPAPAAETHGGTPAAAERLASLRQYRDDHVAAVLSGRPERMMRHHPEGIRLMPPNHPTIFGPADASSYYKAFSRRFLVTQYGRELTETLDLSTRVVEIGQFTMKLVLRATGQQHELIGRYMNIWEKHESGAVSLMTEAWNYDRYLPIERDLRFADVPGVRTALEAHVPIRDNISFELAALNKLMQIAVSEHDANVWSQFYADDAVLISNHNPVFRGRSAVEAFMDKHATAGPVFEKLDVRTDRIDSLGAYVIEYATHVANWRNGDSSGVNTGKDLRIWRREPDCSLKIVWHIGSYD